MRELKNVNFRNNYLISLGEIISRIPLIFTMGYLAKDIGPEAFGAWSLILVMQTLMITLSGAGLPLALIRYGPNAEDNIAYQYLILAIKRSTLFLVIMSIFVYFNSNSIGFLLNIDREYRWLLLVSCVMTIGSIFDGHLDKYFKARTLVNRQIMYLFTRTFAEIVSVIIVFSYLDFIHPSNAISTYILIVVFIKLISYPWLFIEKNLKIKNKIKLTQQKTFLNFAYMLIPSILLTWIIVQIDRIILGWMLTPIELGIYAFSATLASYIGIVSYSIMPLFQSLSASYYDKGEFQMLRNLFEIWQYLFLSVTTILMIIVVFFSQEILYLTAGEEYSKLPHLLLMLTGAVCLDHFFGQYQLVFNLAEKPKLSTLVNSIKLLFMIIFIPIFINFLGVNGAALGVIFAVIIVNIFRYKIATNLIDIGLTFFVKLYLFGSILTILLFSYIHSLNLFPKSFFVIFITGIISIFFIYGRKKLSYFNSGNF